MNKKPVFFSDAFRKAAESLLKANIELEKVVVIRDIYGRISLAFDTNRKIKVNRVLSTIIDGIGPYRGGVLFREDFFDPNMVFNDPGIVKMQLPEWKKPIRLLDRQIVGQDWLFPKEEGKIPRLVFYSFKGGVGRSTAIAFLAYHLANKGKRVLLFDLDLESPGLSSLLLPLDKRADFGLIDWFVEDGVGQGDEVITHLVSSSPLVIETRGAIRVAAAAGLNTGNSDYLSKLSRVYADIHKDGGVERFGTRARRLVEELEKQEQPDVVLIDSRAGLHDIAAISIVNLSSIAYLFVVGTDQNWEGYRMLFSHWQAYPEILKKIRDRLVMVHALFPESEQEKKADKFLQESYALFSDTLYESIEPNSDESEVFNFDLGVESAPHYPVRIKWNNRLQEFSPILISKGILSEDDINAVFGDFYRRVELDLRLGDTVDV